MNGTLTCHHISCRRAAGALLTKPRILLKFGIISPAVLVLEQVQCGLDAEVDLCLLVNQKKRGHTLYIPLFRTSFDPQAFCAYSSLAVPLTLSAVII